jgi:uncharacterized protein
MTSFDPRGPMVIELRELGRRPGSNLQVRREVVVPDTLGAGVAAVRAGSQMGLDLRLEATGDGVLATGAATVQVAGECSRCLVEVSWQQRVPWREFYLESGAVRDDADPMEDDVTVLVGDVLDLEPAIRDAVVLALPLAPVCQGDCPGLCVECGARLAEDPTHQHQHDDPRWAALTGFEQSNSEED